MNNLLVAVDFSKITEAVIDHAANLAKALDAKLWVLHVTSDETQAVVYESTQFTGYSPEFVSMPGDIQLARDLSAEEIKREHNELLGISAKLREQGVDSQALLIKGAAAKTIVAKAEELDAGMIILGSHGHGLLHKALLGSVSEAVMNQTNRCVLVVPSPEK